MIANTVKFILLWSVYLTGLVFALILMYASPSEVVHNFEASLYYAATSVATFGILYSLSFEEEKNSFMKILFLLSILVYIFQSIAIALIYIYANPAGDFADVQSSYVALAAIFLYITSFVIVLLKKGANKNAQ